MKILLAEFAYMVGYGTAQFGHKKGKSRNTIVVDGKVAEIVKRLSKGIANTLVKEEYDKLQKWYCIFITENDVTGEGMPIYHAERVWYRKQENVWETEPISFM